MVAAALRPATLPGLVHSAGLLVALAAGAWLATRDGLLAWCAGQLVLACAFVHAFVVLHEAGHRTLFPGRAANRVAGVVAGFVALIPFAAWRRIHARHHRFTGWQDLDATTESLVPRERTALERAAVDFAWRTWLPLFSIVYRLQNYWNLRRIRPFLVDPARDGDAIRTSILLHVAAYTALAVAAGPLALATAVGPALIFSLMIEDVLLLSQHTHMPQHRSEGRRVRPFPAMAQAEFTRSLALPRPLSALVMHFDLHELHHMYPGVPGYRLLAIGHDTANTVHWLTWIRAAKRLRGSTFVFSTRDRTGAPV